MDAKYVDMEKGYLSGFGNHFETESLNGALPKNQNSPQKVSYGLYAEQLSGSAFTAPRSENLKTWLYRIRPSVLQGSFKKVERNGFESGPFIDGEANPNPLRWDPMPLPGSKGSTDFLNGISTVAGNGDPHSRKGIAVHLYGFNQSMNGYFSNADGEMLFVPWKGIHRFATECGVLECGPGEIAVIPRGMKFQVGGDGVCAGYICENYGQPFRLPQLGPIGANGLANPRHFLTPIAKYEDKEGKFSLTMKFLGNLWEAPLGHSPLDVVAWQGNYAPYKYDLRLFNTINTVSFDHPDPSIFTVLSAPSETPGTSVADFVIFPERWMVAEHTFRPPYYHRNVMSEYMGLIYGEYDAKTEGFVPGGGSLHNCMQPHGPESAVYEKAIQGNLAPQYYGKTLAFMFESAYVLRPTASALKSKALQKDYSGCWRGLKSHFTPPKK